MSDQSAPYIHCQHYYSISDPSDKTVGSCSVVMRHGAAMISNLWVEGEHRRKGYGRALLTRVVQDHCTQPMYLHVAAYTDQGFSDAQLIAWYQRFGFRVTDFPGAMLRPAGPLPED